MTNPLDAVLRPVANLLNRNIAATTPARELCLELDGKTIAIRVRDTSLAMYFEFNDTVVTLATDTEIEPDVVITGSLLTLASMAGAGGERAIRAGELDLSGDAGTAKAFQDLLAYAKPDIEEELSTLIGDVAAHQLGEVARGISNWAREARSTMGTNIREYLQEESRDLPSRYEVERFANQVDTLRDDVARLDARLGRLEKDV
ncbi:MAG: SCP2 sterol-binding domain-containing protein [Proteobacteria bacterium]|nr:SCP2 sterol-binding domain-containing protein [Pseudomonadota bacterium]